MHPAVLSSSGNTIYGVGGVFANGPPGRHYGLGYRLTVGGAKADGQRIRVADYQVVLPAA